MIPRITIFFLTIVYMDEHELDARLGEIEDRLDELEDKLKNQAGNNSKNTKSKTKKRKKTYKKEKKTKNVDSGSTEKKKGTRKKNEFFEKMLQAKKENAASFQYNGKTYVGTKHKNLGMVYKRK